MLHFRICLKVKYKIAQKCKLSHNQHLQINSLSKLKSIISNFHQYQYQYQFQSQHFLHRQDFNRATYSSTIYGSQYLVSPRQESVQAYPDNCLLWSSSSILSFTDAQHLAHPFTIGSSSSRLYNNAQDISLAPCLLYEMTCGSVGIAIKVISLRTILISARHRHASTSAVMVKVTVQILENRDHKQRAYSLAILSTTIWM